jgi:Mg2+ and Co2+ transporter CorA
MTADYLAYTLIDAVIDQYDVALDEIGEHRESPKERWRLAAAA